MVDGDKYEAIMAEFLSRMDEAATAFEREMSRHRDTLQELMDRQANQGAGDGGPSPEPGSFEASTIGGREAANRAATGYSSGPNDPGPGLADKDLKRAGWCVPSTLFD